MVFIRSFYVCILAAIMTLMISGCAMKNHQWSPYIGCPEYELRRNWGMGGDSSSFYSEYGSSHSTWYNKNVLFGVILPGYSSEPFTINILISTKDGKIETISYY
jgi:hypothetical protein